MRPDPNFRGDSVEALQVRVRPLPRVVRRTQGGLKKITASVPERRLGPHEFTRK